MTLPAFPKLSGARSVLARVAVAGSILVVCTSAFAQETEEPIDAAAPQALGGACDAAASLGELSLAGIEADVTSPGATDSSSADPAGSSSGDAAMPAYTAALPEGFVSLAGDAPPLVTSCVAAGAPAAAAEEVAPDALAAAADVAPAITPAPEVAPEPPAPSVVAEPVAPPPVATVATAEPRPKPAPRPRPRKPPAEALKAWWPAAEAGKLNLRFAGEAAFGEAIALLFDAPFSDASALAQHVEVKNRAGKTVEGKWQVVTSNPQMVALRVPPGLYQVRVGESLAAANGLRFQRTAEGKIFVR